MFRQMQAALARPSWSPDAQEGDELEMMRHRRWRIMQSILPFDATLDPLPAWVKTPDQFVGWLSCRIDSVGLRAYFHEIQAIAKQTSDLTLLRFARKYLGEL